MKELSVNHLLGIKYINENDINLIFETADHFKEVINRPIKKFLHYEILPLPIFSSKIVPEQNSRLSWLKNDYLLMLSVFRQLSLRLKKEKP